MSRNNKYIEDFDRRAGEPAGFDSLFRFDGDELTANRRIKTRSKTKRLAAACAAAAVMTAAVFGGLSYINTEGLSQSTGVNEKADPSGTSVQETKKEPLRLSELAGKFDYSAAGDSGGLYSSSTLVEVSEPPSAVIRFTVSSKAYSLDERGETTLVYYSLSPKEWFVKEGFEDSVEESFTLCTPSAQGREFQKGTEYIAAFNISEMDGIRSYTLSGPGFARKTEYGWLGCISGSDFISRALQNEGEEVTDDINGTGSYRLIPSQQTISGKLLSALLEESRYRNTSASIFSADTDASAERTTCGFDEIFKNADFERVRYENDSDRTLLILDNEQYFTLVPGLSGYVVFAGRGDNGSLVTAIEIDPGKSFPAATIMFSGLSELTVTSGKIIDEYTQIGSCDSTPVYVMVTDNRGEPVNIDL